MRRLAAVQRVVPLLLAMLVAVRGHHAQSQQVEAPPLERPIRFQRLFVPESEPELLRELIKNKLARKRSEFQRYVAALQPRSETKTAAQAHLTRGVYRARLDGAQLVDGEATLEVRHSGEGRASLSLGDSNLAIREATWQTSPPTAAVLATKEDGRRFVQVERSASLSLGWSLGGFSDPFGEVTLSASLPPCAANRLILEIPSGWRLESQDGFVQRGAALPAREGRPTTFPWTVELGATRDVNLRVTRDSGARRQLVPLRQQLTYELSPSGGELNGSLFVDTHQDSLRQLELQLPPDLDLLWVRLGDQDLPLTVTSAPPDRPRRVMVHFPQPISGAERELRFYARLPVKTDRLWSLPGISVQGAAWQEGVATLRVMEPLHLLQLQTTRCRQYGSSSLPAPSKGRSIDIQYYAADAGVDVLLGAPRPRVEVTAGTTLEVDSVAVAAQVVAEVRAVEGLSFELEMSLPPAWTVESVRTEPPEALYDYDVIPRGQQPQVVRLRLSAGVSPGQAPPLRVLLRAHRRLPSQGVSLSIDQIRLAEFTTAKVIRRLIAVPSAQFQLSGDVHVQRLDPLALPELDARLVSGGADRIVLVDDRRANPLRLTLVTERPRFTADVEITAHIDAASLLEDYRLQIRPKSTPVGRLRVHFSHHREERLQWSLTGESNAAVLAQKLSTTDAPTPGMAGGETWEITLQRPRSVPFELRAVRRSGGKGKRRISLLSAPQAETQSGTVTVESAAGAGVEVDTDALRAVPADTRTLDRLRDTRAVYRYEPSQEASIDVALSAAADAQAALWAWSCRLTTHCSVDRISHTAAYDLETSGQRQVDLVLPEDCELQQVLVDGNEVRGAAPNNERRISVPLPAEVRYPTLVVVYREANASLPTVAGRLRPRLPELVDAPVMQRQWTVWTPPGYRALERQDADPPSLGGAIGRRLLGSLWRGAGRPFELFSEADWGDLGSEPASRGAARRTAGRCLQTLNEVSIDARPVSAGRNWGRLVLAYDAAVAAGEQSPGPPPLRIDALALASVGVGPQSPLPSPLETTPAGLAPGGEMQKSPAVSLLDSANLVLLATSTEALLTTADFAQQLTEASAADNLGAVVIVDELPAERDSAHPASGRIRTPQAWAASSNAQLTPWRATTSQAFATLSDSGWNAAHFELGDDEALSCAVVRWPLLTALSWAMVLIVASAAFLLSVRSPASLVLLLGIAVVSALLTPEPFTTLATGGVLGVLLACGMTAALSFRGFAFSATGESASVQRGRGDTTRTLHRAVSMLLIAFACATATVGAAMNSTAWGADDAANGEEDASADSSSARPLLYPVVVEVDEENKPVDKYVYVPDSLWFALVERVERIEQPRHEVLLQGADYECRLEWRDDETLAAEQFTAVFQFEVVGEPAPMSRYILPLDRSRLDLLVDGALLDGRPADIDLAEDGARLSVAVDQPGKHRLELHFHPRHELADAGSTLEFEIPPVSNARLRLRYPRSVSGVNVPLARGATSVGPGPGEMRVDLGPVDRLRIDWPTRGGLDTESARLEVEEMMWLKVGPRGVQIDARYRFHRDGLIDEVRLLADPRLRLLQIGADQPVRQRHEQTADVKTIHLELEQSFEKEVTLQLSFRRTGTSGIGNLRLPDLRAVADRTVSRRLGVTVDPQLEFEQIGRLPAYPRERFLADWDGADTAAAPPDLTFTIPVNGNAAWSLATRPKSPTSVFSTTTDVVCSRNSADVVFQAEIDTEDGYVFQHRLATPKDLQIESVSVVANDQQAAARWSRDDDGVLTVMLDRRVTGRQQLRLSGSIPVGDQRVAAPRITLFDAEQADAVVRIYRDTDVRVRVLDDGELSPLDEADVGSPPTEFGSAPRHWSSLRLVAAFQQVGGPNTPAGASADGAAPAADGAAPAAAGACSLDVAPNRPRTRCRCITTLSRNDGQWNIEADCGLNVEGGLLDEFWVEVPDRLKEPFEITPSADFEVTSVPGQSRRRLVIRPAEPIRGAAAFSIRASLSPSLAGERIVFPDIAPLGVDELEQFIVVPTRAASQRYVWETSGLQAAELPGVGVAGRQGEAGASSKDADENRAQASLGDAAEDASGETQTDDDDANNADDANTDDAASDDGRAVWRVVASRYSASLKLLERSAAVPAQIHLADIHFAWDGDGACRGLATFDLEPAGLTSCVLVLPPGCRLVQANVAGLPAQLSKLAEDRWRLKLGPAQLPQRMVVLFEGQLPPEPLPRRIVVPPRLLSIPVERTLWTIYAPSAAGRVRVLSEHAQSGAADLDLIRYSAYASLVDRAADFALEQPRIDVDRWYLPWARRLAAGRERLAAYSDASGVNPYQQRIDSIEEQQHDDAERLDVTHIRSLAAAAPGPADVWSTALGGRTPTLYCSQSGAAERLELAVVRPAVSGVGWRLLLAPLLTAAALIVYLLVKRGVLGEWLLRWPHVFGVLLGLAWWLWLTPSLLGWVIVLVSVVSAWRLPWRAPRGSQPAPLSSVFRHNAG